MTLLRRVVITALLISIPAAAIVLAAGETLRTRDQWIALERVAESYKSEIVREMCERDSQWFLAGPRTGRPSMAARNIPDPDVFLPRPSADELPFEVFAYNDQFGASSTAGPRLPESFRRAMRSSPPTETVYGTYDSENGTGIQIAFLTGWTPGPCTALLVRMQPVPNRGWQRAGLFVGFGATFFVATMLAFTPTLRRIWRTSREMGEAAKAGFASVAPDASKDEISRFAFVFNEAAAEIHRRGAENADRVEALRRHVDRIVDDVAGPLADLERALAESVGSSASTKPDEMTAALWKAHDTSMRLENLIAAARLKSSAQPLEIETTDVAAIVGRVVDRLQPLASMQGVSLTAVGIEAPITASVAPLLELAVANVVDNAVRYNEAGGRVDVRVEAAAPGRFAIRVTDTGRGVSDEEFRGLTAIRRFRGDEASNPRPNMRGLGLAIALEIADRSGLALDLIKPASGGFEAVLATKPADASR